MTDHAKALRAIVNKHSLRYRDVAELALVSVKCVEGWLSSPGAASHRPVRERDVLLITHRLPEWLSGRSQATAVECKKAKKAANGEAWTNLKIPADVWTWAATRAASPESSSR